MSPKPFAAVLVILVAACRPPASDNYVQRIELGGGASGPTVLATPPDVAGAIWAGSGGPERIVFGKPGEPPYLALACAGTGRDRVIEVTRFAETDPKAKGMMALVGNGHAERLKIDARWNGRGWLWEGRYRPSDTRLDGLTGVRKLELTIPGAGTLVLEGSPRPGEFLALCRRLAGADASAQPPHPAESLPAPE